MMAGQTKMIIITSNEDLIRQFSTNKSSNTHIIDLDNNNQIDLISKDNNNVINLALLAQLSELNSNSDQVYKRELDSPHVGRAKSAKVSKKMIDLICTVCGDRAIGFNYDVLSCASCKAFFRRNAHQQTEKLRCLTGHSQCSVNHGVRRKCQRCRLERCFTMGMRKDFILTEEEKQRRRKRLEENRNLSNKRLSSSESAYSSASSCPLSNSEGVVETFDEIDHLMMNISKDDENLFFHDNMDLIEMEDLLFETLSVEDWVAIQSVQSSFLSMFKKAESPCYTLDVTSHVSALISWSAFVDSMAHDFINFFRQIDEFEGLNGADRFILIKYNLLSLFILRKCMHYEPLTDPCSITSKENHEKHRRFFVLCGDAEQNGVRENFHNLLLSLVQITGQDPTLISLLLASLIFSKGLSMSETEPILNDSLAVHRAQSYYITLLWNYMVNKQGELRTIKQFTQILTHIFRLQSSAKRSRKFFRGQFISSDTVDKITPLMQTVLHIS